MLELAQVFTKESLMPNRTILSNVGVLGPYWGHVFAILEPFLASSIIALIVDIYEG